MQATVIMPAVPVGTNINRGTLREMADQILRSAGCRPDGRPEEDYRSNIRMVFTPVGGKVRKK